MILRTRELLYQRSPVISLHPEQTDWYGHVIDQTTAVWRGHELILLSKATIAPLLPQINSCIFNMAFPRLIKKQELLIPARSDSKRKFLPPPPITGRRRRRRGVFLGEQVVGCPLFPKSSTPHPSSRGCSSCPVTGTVTPEHSAAAKHLAPSPTVQMKNKHNLPFWVSSKWGISWQIGWRFIMQRGKAEQSQTEAGIKGCVLVNGRNCGNDL